MKFLRSKRLLAVLLILLAVVAGAAVLARRYGYKTVPNAPLITEIKQNEDPSFPYSIAFVQFDDTGHFRNRSQLDNVLRRIQSDAQRSGAVIAMFVHGWNNSCQ